MTIRIERDEMRNGMWMLFGILGMGLLIAGCLQPGPSSPAPAPSSVEPQVEFTYYSSPLFFIYYPRGWSVDDQKTEPGVFLFTAPLEDANDQVAEEFVVQVWRGNESTATEFRAFEQNLLTTEDTVFLQEATTYQNRDAFVMEYEGPDPRLGKVMLYKTLFFRNGAWVYRLNYALEKSKQVQYQPIMEEILNRFVVGSYGAN